MKTIRERISSTHVDRHGDAMSVEALKSAAEQISQCYVPMCYDHDPRFPTLGRMVRAEIVPVENGHHVLQGVSEVWETTDTPESTRGDGRTIPIRTSEISVFEVVYDRSFRDSDGQALIHDLGKMIPPESQPQLFLKKALEPVSVLTIAAGIFTIGGIATGFFNKLGADIYDTLKRRLIEYYETKVKSGGLINFTLVVNREGRCFEVIVLVENPDSQHLELLLEERFLNLDDVVADIAAREPDLARVTLLFHNSALRFLHALRRDGFPSLVNPALVPPFAQLMSQAAKHPSAKPLRVQPYPLAKLPPELIEFKANHRNESPSKGGDAPSINPGRKRHRKNRK